MVESMSDDQKFRREFEQAQTAAIQANLTEPRAIAAYYDIEAKLIVVKLRSGASFSFPPDIAQGLRGAEARDLAQVEITPMGDGLHWKSLDADFSVTGLLAGIFGTKRWMATLQQQWSQQAS
ncbi:MAG: DUF2442 domain-containing protein [Plectolyngbya sp. WJT66-NPBG17]|jgi:hypothetical protein|nr:DUF2442 domain-containing protein [Plectolyngbya sp. WJT66-NPBG17]MBW4524783.1 DUF2442 domain-containing protein [Phormidium tanganyikae FI6-MK23]